MTRKERKREGFSSHPPRLGSVGPGGPPPGSGREEGPAYRLTNFGYGQLPGRLAPDSFFLSTPSVAQTFSKIPAGPT